MIVYGQPGVGKTTFAAQAGALLIDCENGAGAIPGLWGYIGIDLVETARGPLVVDVNPRLTTSYAGLAAATGCNPARLVLDLLDHGATPFAGPEAVTPVEITVDAAKAGIHA